jgi:hypothetical protein
VYESVCWKRGSHNGYIALATMWNRLSRCGSYVDLGLTTIAEGSPRPADGGRRSDCQTRFVRGKIREDTRGLAQTLREREREKHARKLELWEVVVVLLVFV